MNTFFFVALDCKKVLSSSCIDTENLQTSQLSFGVPLAIGSSCALPCEDEKYRFSLHPVRKSEAYYFCLTQLPPSLTTSSPTALFRKLSHFGERLITLALTPRQLGRLSRRRALLLRLRRHGGPISWYASIKDPAVNDEEAKHAVKLPLDAHEPLLRLDKVVGSASVLQEDADVKEPPIVREQGSQRLPRR